MYTNYAALKTRLRGKLPTFKPRPLPVQSVPTRPGSKNKKKRRDLLRERAQLEQQVDATSHAAFEQSERAYFSNSDTCGGFESGNWHSWSKFGKTILARGWLPLYGLYIIKLPNGAYKLGIALSNKDSSLIRESRLSLVRSRVKEHVKCFTIPQLNKVKVLAIPVFNREEIERARVAERAALFMVFAYDNDLLNQTLSSECGVLPDKLVDYLVANVGAFIKGQDPLVKFGKRIMRMSNFE